MAYTNSKGEKVTLSGTPAQQNAEANRLGYNYVPDTGATTTIGPMSKEALDALTKSYADAVAAHPGTKDLATTNTPDSVMNAYMTGDWSGITDNQGKPFSAADQADAVTKATAQLAPYYQAQQQKDTQDTEAALKQKQLDYQKQLADQGAQFQSDKTNLDQAAANQGVLFSGGRAQKAQTLQDTYARDSAYNQASTGNDIGNIARDFQYKYGNNAANGLSQYYNLGGNSYNTNVARGSTTPNGLSSVYSPSTSNFQGTVNNEAKAQAQQRAAGMLWNKGNKLVQGGYKNQY